MRTSICREMKFCAIVITLVPVPHCAGAGLACIGGQAREAAATTGSESGELRIRRLISPDGSNLIQELDSITINDSDLRSLTPDETRKLKRIVLERGGMTGRGIWHLRDARSAEFLSLNNVPLGEIGFRAIAQMTALKVLKINDYVDEPPVIMAQELAKLRNLRQLTELTLQNGTITDESLKALPIDVWDELHTLRLKGGEGFTQEGLRHIAQLPSLRSLSIYIPEMTQRSIAELSRFSELRSLGITSDTFHGGNITELRRIKSLTTLGMRIDNLVDSNLEGVQFLERLTVLNLPNPSQGRLTDAVMPLIGELEYLEYLNLSGQDITDAGLAHLKGHKRLRLLSLNRTKVSLDEASVMRMIPSLESVKVSPER